MPTPPEGILLLDKPKGVTSFDVVQHVRRQYNEKKVGHAGTLDPLASGLMVVGVGAGTKKLKAFVSLDKTYVAEICIGEKSATGDAEGEIREKVPVPHIDTKILTTALQALHGIHRLPVSVYSAMKRGGEALYKKARRGEHVTVPVRDMEIHDAELLGEVEYKNDCAYTTVRFSVGSGTYVRSLAEELGRKLGYPARLENLRRTQVGEFRVEDAIRL